MPRPPPRLAPLVLLSVALVCTLPATLAAQEEEEGDGTGEPLVEELRRRIRSPALTVGALFQFTGDFQDERSASGENGFGVANARIRLSGALDGGVGYLFQSNFGSLLDLRLSWSGSPALAVDGGLYKTPFSAEFLTPAGRTDFVTRSRTVNALRPGRQVGVQVRGRVADGRLGYRAGVFNGEGGVRGNDDEHFLYGARLSYERPFPGEAGGHLVVGVNGSTSDDPAAVTGATADALRFTGADRLLGVDLRVTRGRWLASAEWLGADPDDDDPDEPEPSGWHATLGFRVTEEGRALVRWDAIRPGLDGVADSDLVVLGYDLTPTRATRVLANVELPAAGGGEPRLRLLGQLHF